MKHSLPRQSRSFTAIEAAEVEQGTAAAIPAVTEFVTLVDGFGMANGAAEKHLAHRMGRRHAAFSVFLLDVSGRLIMQQRHPSKYHSGGLWANSCCGHPRPGELVSVAAARRVFEELGVRVPIKFGFRTAYCAELDNGMIENEIVAVFFGIVRVPLAPNPAEISQIRRMTRSEVGNEVRIYPSRYAHWLRHYFENHSDDIDRLCATTIKSDPWQQLPFMT